MNIYQTFISNALKRVAQQFYPELYIENAKQANNEAFVVFSVALILDKPMEDVFENMVVNGKEDGGIDAVFIDNYNGRPTVHIFQCKNTEKVSANVLEKFEDNFEKIFGEGRREKAHSKDLIKFLGKINYWERFENTLINTQLHYVFMGSKKDDGTKNSIEQVNSNKIQYWDAHDLYNQAGQHIAEDNRRPIKFTFKPENSNTSLNGGRQALVSFSISNIRSANFRMSALDLCKLLDNEKQVNETINTLFSSNIRGFLGRDNFTNSRILSTLQHQRFKYYFPFLNNGLTMICEKMQLPDEMHLGNYLIETQNPLIINGLQTTNVIYQAYLNDIDLSNVFINVRLYETTDFELIDLVTDATNTQSSIYFRDKISNKPFMKRLKAFFADRQVALITKRGESFKNFYSQSAFEYNVENHKVLVVWYKVFFIEHTKVFFGLGDEDEIIKDLYEAEFTLDHPLYSLLNDKFENFASQVFWSYECMFIIEPVLKIKEFKLEKVVLIKRVLFFLLKNRIFDKKDIQKVIDNIIEIAKETPADVYNEYPSLWSDLEKKYPSISTPRKITVKELNNLYIPV